MIELAHAACGIDGCEISLATSECDDDGSRPDCMINASLWMESSINARTREIVTLTSRVVPMTQGGFSDAIERYGMPTRLADMPDNVEAFDMVDAFMEMGKLILQVDEDLVTLTVYFLGGKSIFMDGGKPEDHFDKVLWADRIAETALNKNAASVLISADAWTAKITHTKLDDLALADRPDRTETLSIVAVSRDGRLLSKQLPYVRHADGSVSFSEAFVEGNVVARYLEPLRKAWGLAAWEAVEEGSA